MTDMTRTLQRCRTNIQQVSSVDFTKIKHVKMNDDLNGDLVRQTVPVKIPIKYVVKNKLLFDEQHPKDLPHSSIIWGFIDLQFITIF